MSVGYKVTCIVYPKLSEPVKIYWLKQESDEDAAVCCFKNVCIETDKIYQKLSVKPEVLTDKNHKDFNKATKYHICNNIFIKKCMLIASKRCS